MGRQVAITKHQGEQCPNLVKPNDFKTSFRSGISDLFKREIILKFLEIKPIKSYVEYHGLKKSLGLEFLEFTDQLELANQSLYYDYLTDFGKKELDFMLIYFMRNYNVHRVQFLAHFANILLIFMPAWEAFAVIKSLVESSNKIKKPANKKYNNVKDKPEDIKLRWHIAHDATDHALLISTFIDFYIDKSINKKRRILMKCFELNFNFDLLVHQLLNTLCSCVLPLDISIHIAFTFIIEGQKVLLRYIYAVLALTKDFFASLTVKKDVLGKLRKECADWTVDQFVKVAFEL